MPGKILYRLGTEQSYRTIAEAHFNSLDQRLGFIQHTDTYSDIQELIFQDCDFISYDVKQSPNYISAFLTELATHLNLKRFVFQNCIMSDRANELVSTLIAETEPSLEAVQKICQLLSGTGQLKTLAGLIGKPPIPPAEFFVTFTSERNHHLRRVIVNGDDKSSIGLRMNRVLYRHHLVQPQPLTSTLMDDLALIFNFTENTVEKQFRSAIRLAKTCNADILAEFYLQKALIRLQQMTTTDLEHFVALDFMLSRFAGTENWQRCKAIYTNMQQCHFANIESLRTQIKQLPNLQQDLLGNLIKLTLQHHENSAFPPNKLVTSLKSMYVKELTQLVDELLPKKKPTYSLTLHQPAPKISAEEAEVAKLLSDGAPSAAHKH